jgi:pyrophosphatase PpaX
MPGPINTILFDLDGTLLDTREFIYQAFEHTFHCHELSVLSRPHLATLMGGSLESIYALLAPAHDPHRLCDTHRSFQEKHLDLAVLFPQVEATLADLYNRGMKMAVVTTRSKRTSLFTLQKAGIAGFFEVVVSGEDVTKLKPDPEPLRCALDKLQAAASQAVMVGDTEVDILAGKNAGLRTIAVTYGFAGAAIAQSAPDFLINKIEAIKDIL